MNLRPYQSELIDKIRYELLSGNKSVVAVLGCGGGKSVICADIAKSSTEKGNRVLFLVHRHELCQQIEQTFIACGVDLNLCQIGMVQTVTRRLEKTETPNLIIVDEAHHSISDSYTRIFNYFPSAIRLGFTATPCRMNEGGLGKVFESLVESVSTKWLIENNYLAPFKYYSVKLADAGNLHIKQGDYDNRELATLMEQNAIYGDTVTNYINIARGKQAIVYCASVKASEETTQAFVNAGILASHVDGTTNPKEREDIMDLFRKGYITVLCNCNLFGEGLDMPDCECVILLRPTKSLTLYIQQSMRSMRYKPNKTATIIDHVGNVFQHGFPDEQREWSLEEKRKKEKSIISVKQCPKCYYCLPSNSLECPECGHIFKETTEERTQRQRKEAELQEITERDLLAVKPYNYYKNIKTFEEMAKFQRVKKYKFGWALHKCIELDIPIPSKYKHTVRRLS